MARLMLRSVTAFVVVVLWQLPSSAQIYTWTYEGDVIPSETSTEGQPPDVSTDGNILTIDFLEGARAQRDIWSYFVTDDGSANTADTWTLDGRLGRPTAPGSSGAAGLFPPYLDLRVGGAGTGGRIILALGRYGTGSLGDNSSVLVYTDELGDYVETVVLGLDVRELNDYRVVGTGAGSYNVYVNDIVAPVFSGNLAQTTSNTLLTISALYHGATMESGMDMLVDFVRFNANTAYDEPPINSILVGDLNDDGFVGQDDLNIILGNWGQNVTQGDWMMGDPSNDGFVGQDDLNDVLGGWGQGTPPAAGSLSAVPEPHCILLMGLGAFLAWPFIHVYRTSPEPGR